MAEGICWIDLLNQGIMQAAVRSLEDRFFNLTAPTTYLKINIPVHHVH
jgi:hypothetical protein